MNIVAKALLIDANQNILVLRRSGTHPHFAYHLDFPGGEVEPGEAEIDAVVREIWEESGIVLPDSRLELAHQTMSPGGSLYLMFTGALEDARPNVVVSWEHDQHEWLPREQLLSRPIPANVDSYYMMVIDYLQDLDQADNS